MNKDELVSQGYEACDLDKLFAMVAGNIDYTDVVTAAMTHCSKYGTPYSKYTFLVNWEKKSLFGTADKTGALVKVY